MKNFRGITYLLLLLAVQSITTANAFFVKTRQAKNTDEESLKQKTSKWATSDLQQITLTKEMQLEHNMQFNKKVRNSVNALLLVNTSLLLVGEMALPSLALSMISCKLLDMCIVEESHWRDRDKERDDTPLSIKFKAMTSLTFSGAAFCFKSRAMELSGGIILLFTQFMQL